MRKKILSIDGGGIKGVFPASFLNTLEESTGKRISEYFDLIVGTSTGGIIALGLGLGFSAKEILTFYEEYGPKIFQNRSLLQRILSIGKAKYSNTSLQGALEQQFGDKKLGESNNRLVIPSLNLENGEVHVYKTAHHPRFRLDYTEKASNIALATSAAPTYFPTYISTSGTPLVDGGLWANNPVGLAVVEAIGVLEWPRDQLDVLSIGCTTEPLNIGRAREMSLGKPYWAFKVAELFMCAQSSGSFGTAQLLAGHSNVLRISPSVPNGRFGLDVVKEIRSLRGLGHTEARKALPSMGKFFVEKADSFIPENKLS